MHIYNCAALKKVLFFLSSPPKAVRPVNTVLASKLSVSHPDFKYLKRNVTIVEITATLSSKLCLRGDAQQAKLPSSLSIK